MSRWTRMDDAVSLSEHASRVEHDAKLSGDAFAIEQAGIAAGRACSAVNNLASPDSTTYAVMGAVRRREARGERGSLHEEP